MILVKDDDKIVRKLEMKKKIINLIKQTFMIFYQKQLTYMQRQYGV